MLTMPWMETAPAYLFVWTLLGALCLPGCQYTRKNDSGDPLYIAAAVKALIVYSACLEFEKVRRAFDERRDGFPTSSRL